MSMISSSTHLATPDDFSENCGFGLIAHIEGQASHDLVKTAIHSLSCMTHRGGVAADDDTAQQIAERGKLLFREEKRRRRIVCGGRAEQDVCALFVRHAQREADEVGGAETNQTDVIILTHDCTESAMTAAIAQMQALPTVYQPIVRIRKEELN